MKMKELYDRVLERLAQAFPKVKSIISLKEIIFEEGEVIVRAMVYFLKIFVIGFVIISLVDYISIKLGVHSFFWQNVIFVILFSLYILSHILGVMLELDELRQKHKEEIEGYESKVQELEETISNLKKEMSRMERDCLYREFYKEKYQDKMNACSNTVDELKRLLLRQGKYGIILNPDICKDKNLVRLIIHTFIRHAESMKHIDEKYGKAYEWVNLRRSNR